MLCAKAYFMLLSLLTAMNAFLAGWIVFKFSCIISDDSFIERVGRLSERFHEIFGFLPKMSWNGEIHFADCLVINLKLFLETTRCH